MLNWRCQLIGNESMRFKKLFLCLAVGCFKNLLSTLGMNGRSFQRSLFVNGNQGIYCRNWRKSIRFYSDEDITRYCKLSEMLPTTDQLTSIIEGRSSIYSVEDFLVRQMSWALVYTESSAKYKFFICWPILNKLTSLVLSDAQWIRNYL